MRGFLASAAASLLAGVASAATGPFLTTVDNQTWIIGNEVWNMTQGHQYGVKLYYKDRDMVGDAVGHYVSYNGAASDLAWTSASIVKNGTHAGVPFIDVLFTAAEGDMHWVIFSGQHGSYQYFVNHALPVLGEFRTLWRLDNTSFPNGRTTSLDGVLPPLADYLAENKVQDETWLTPDGSSYITKYNWTSWIRTQDYYGVYGDDVGSWYINAGKDYYNGDHTKQELMVHRESATGDAVQLNMIHGTHFMVSSSDVFPDGKMWGPWLWYLNDGSKPDAAAQAEREFAAWPYAWLDDAAYQSRGSVSGRLTLSDGRPAAYAAVFLGDVLPSTKSSLDQGSDYYYTAYTDASGRFSIPNVRTGSYGLQAWPAPSNATSTPAFPPSSAQSILDVSTTFTLSSLAVQESKATDLGALTWQVSPRTKLFQVGDFDRLSAGFLHGDAPYQHALVASCPADLTYRVGCSKTADWCFGQTYKGNWTVQFRTSVDPAAAKPGQDAKLIVSLASYSTGSSSTVWVNDVRVGNLTSGAAAPDGLPTHGLASDPGLYRSATAAGEWRYFEFDFAADTLRKGRNEVRFEMTRETTWHGFMWDSVILEW